VAFLFIELLQTQLYKYVMFQTQVLWTGYD